MSSNSNLPRVHFAHNLVHFKEDYYSRAYNDRIPQGKINAQLVARIVSLGIALLLHAVSLWCAFGMLCLKIGSYFTSTNPEQMNRYKQVSGFSMRQSVKSMGEVVSPKKPCITKPLNQEDRIEIVIDTNANQAGRALSTTPNATLDADQISFDDSASRFSSRRCSSDSEPYGIFAYGSNTPNTEAKNEIRDLFSYPGNFKILNLHPSEKARLNSEEMRRKKQIRGLTYDKKPLSAKEVTHDLNNNFNWAQLQAALNQKEIPFLEAPRQLNNQWATETRVINQMQCALSEFKEDENVLMPEWLTEQFTINMDGKDVPICLFGISEPMVGIRAAKHVKKHIKEELISKLSATTLSEQGIYNAITQSLLNLNKTFLETKKDRRVGGQLELYTEHGASTTIALIINQTLWSAQIGTTGALYTDPQDTYRLTPFADPTNDQMAPKIEERGGWIDEQGLVNGKLNVATIIGRVDLKGAASSKPHITQVPLSSLENGYLLLTSSQMLANTSPQWLGALLNKKSGLSPLQLAKNLSYTVYNAEQKKRGIEKQTNPISCLIVKLAHPTTLSDEEWVKA